MPDLQATNEALRVCWLWQSWTEPCKPWHGLPIPIDNKVRDLFAASVSFHLGDGHQLMFWTDSCLSIFGANPVPGMHQEEAHRRPGPR
jgi:hypothetical protein